MKDVPIGNDDFKSIRENDDYYVDKTKLIENMLKMVNTKVFLFTRPRRFGKTLNLSMLDAFFNIDYKETDKGWFDGLMISDDTDAMRQKNSSPVIFLNMKGLDLTDMDSFLRSISLRISDICIQHSYLLDAEEVDIDHRKRFAKLKAGEGDQALLGGSLELLTKMLHAYHKRPAVILIDEYDIPIQNAHSIGIQKDILGFVKNLFSNGLKSNESLRFGAITGVMQIAKESIFSGLNNLYVNNIFSKDFDECYGFTEAEMKEMLSYYGHPEKFDECREWYDGYTFGDAEVYNPWSVLNYVNSGFVAGRYWSGTSGNLIIKTLLDNTDDDLREELRTLSMAGAIEKEMDPYVVYADIESNTRALYSIMAMSGYLKSSKTLDGYSLSIPNKEMFEVYSDMILEGIGFPNMAMSIRKLFRTMQIGDTESMERGMHDLMKDTLSAKVLDSEHAYQTYLIGMMMGFCGNYRIYGDRLESGDGFADIIFERKGGSGVNIIIELKRSSSENDLEKDAQRAMDQILEKDYAHGLDGKTMLYGISFHSKKSCIISKEYRTNRSFPCCHQIDPGGCRGSRGRTHKATGTFTSPL